MEHVIIAVGLGVLSGLLAVVAGRVPMLVRFLAAPGYGGGSRFADCFFRSRQRWLPVVRVPQLGRGLVVPPLAAVSGAGSEASDRQWCFPGGEVPLGQP